MNWVGTTLGLKTHIRQNDIVTVLISMALVHTAYILLWVIYMDITDDQWGQGPNAGLLSHGRGQRLGPALANPRGLWLCAPVSSYRGVVTRVLQGGSVAEHNTMATGNYARCGMGKGSGRDIWTLTSNPGSLISHNTAAGLEMAAG